MQQETPFTDMDWARMELEGAANVFRRSLSHSLHPSPSLSLSVSSSLWCSIRGVRQWLTMRWMPMNEQSEQAVL